MVAKVRMMPHFFHIRDELTMPKQHVFLQFRDDTHVHDFLYDRVDQDMVMIGVAEDNHLLYGDPRWTPDGEENWFWYKNQKGLTAEQHREREAYERAIDEERRHEYYADYVD